MRVFEVDPDVDDAPAHPSVVVEVAALQEVECDVGANLIHGPLIASFGDEASETVDAIQRGVGPVGGDVEGEEAGGAVEVGVHPHPAFIHALRILVLGGGSVGFDRQPLHPAAELGGRALRRLFQSKGGHLPCHLVVQTARVIADHPGLGQVDPPRPQGRPHVGEAVDQVAGHAEVEVGRPPRPGEGGADLVGGEGMGVFVAGSKQLDDRVTHLGHRRVEEGLVVGDLARQRLEVAHPVGALALVALEGGDGSSHEQARRDGAQLRIGAVLSIGGLHGEGFHQRRTEHTFDSTSPPPA